MKYRNKLMVIALLMIAFTATGLSLEGYVVEQGPSPVDDMIYNWGSADTNAYYQDAIAYSDVALMVCREDGSTPDDKYVGLTYLMNQDSSTRWSLISYESNNDFLPVANQEVSFGGQTCKRTSIGGFTVSPSSFSEKTPEVDIAAHPSEAYMLVSDSQDGANPEFIETNSETAGNYGGSASYDFSSNTIDMSISSITVSSDQGTNTYNPGTSGRGINEDRPMIVGMCSNADGTVCPTDVEILEDSNFPRNYDFDIPSNDVNDQNVYTRYGVANSKRFTTLDIGADSTVSSLNVDLDPIFYSQTQTVDFTIQNNGNVPITSSFDVDVTIDGPSGEVYANTFVIDEDLAENGGSTSREFEWEAFAESGDYTVTVTTDASNDLTEIGQESKTSTNTFELLPITLPDIYVNEELKEQDDTEFENAGVPYNFTVDMMNSDNDTLSNSRVEIVEKDGISSFSPSQIYERQFDEDGASENYSIESENRVEFLTDIEGEASITMIPTGNVLLKEEYSHLPIQNELDYEIYLAGEEEDGTEFTFVIDEEITNQYPLEVNNPENYEGSSDDVEFPNMERHVGLVMNQVYTVFAKFWGAVV